MTVIDTHLHLWDLVAGHYSWLGPQHGTLYRSFGPAEAAMNLAGSGIDAAVLVQAEDTVAETRSLLEIARQHDWVHGVVGWVHLDDPREATQQLEELDGPLLVGIRQLVHDDPRDGVLHLPPVRESLALLAGRDLPFDVPDAWPRHLDAVSQLAAELPSLTVVVDHLGKPPRGTDEMAAWETSLRKAASSPNTVAKVSGLQTPGQPFTARALEGVFDIALDCFGADRLMFGSDWPMTVPSGGYPTTYAVLRELVSKLSPDEQDALLSGTAQKVYGRVA